MSHLDSFHSWCTVSVEKFRFCSSHQNSDSQKIIKSAIREDFYRYINTYFSTPIGVICSIKVPIGNFTSVENDSVQNQMFSILRSKSRQSDCSKKLNIIDFSG